MRAWTVFTALGLACAAVITWAIIATNNWEHRCTRAGGHVVSTFTGYITTYNYTYDGKGNITGMTPVMTPQYDYTCEGLPAGVKP